MAGPASRSSAIRCLALVLALVAGLLAGCGGTPRERYRVLSYFFDGVPNPDAPKIAARTQAADTENQVITASVIVSQHKPYVEKKCDACHRGANGEIQEFEQAFNACVRCHKNVSTERPLMHGPVAREACRFCHTPHESQQPALLSDTPVKVCSQCHDKQLLGNTPQEHNDGVTSCLQCHFGHGGEARYFLKPATQPASRPTTLPSSLPTTAPSAAGQPAATAPVLAFPAAPRATDEVPRP